MTVETEDMPELNRIVDECSYAACRAYGNRSLTDAEEHHVDIPWVLECYEITGAEAEECREGLSR